MDQPVMVNDGNRTFEIRKQLGAALRKLAEKAPTDALRTSCLELARRCAQPSDTFSGARSSNSGDTPMPHEDRSSMRKFFGLAVPSAAADGAEIARKRFERRCYPSRRSCPACGGKMFYVASRWSRHHTRTCESCGYSDSKVKMIRLM
jgi:hypothetical protein